jgi:hypothetical protein
LTLDVDEENLPVDDGLAGSYRERPGHREALAAVCAGHSVVIASSTGSCQTHMR